MSNPLAEPQYRPYAYVCSASCVHQVEQQATVTFSWIYQHRPNNCRYAVAGQQADVVVWDLYNVKMTGTGKLVTPNPVSVHTTVNSAIMATTMLYGDA